MLNLPYFTVTDNKLLKAQFTRDPLGLFSIWSTIGRGLVPFLAGSAWKIEGIIAVMVIARLAENPLLSSQSDKNPIGFWRLMEGLVEYHLFQQESHSPCHGKRVLAANGEELTITTNETNILCNGLRQYYRGTCVRAPMLDKAYRISNDDWCNTLDSIFKEQDQAIKTLASALDKTMVGQNKLKPADHYKSLSPLWDAVFENDKIRTLLKKQLLGNDDQICFAQWSAMASDDENHARFETIREKARKTKTWSLHREIDAVFHCAPFISLLERLLDLLLALDGEKIQRAADRLSSTALPDAGAQFLKLRDNQLAYPDQRFNTFFKLAEHARAKQWPDLIVQLIQHHRQVTEERGKSPFIQIDNQEIVVVSPIEGGINELIEALASPIPWHYGFYAPVTGSIYNQLFGEQV